MESVPVEERPLPLLLPLTRPFWEAASKHTLVMQRCADCGEFIWYPRAWCVKCGSTNYEWTNLAGGGKVYSFTIIRQVVSNSKFFESKIPFAVGIIELDEGPRMISNIVGCAIDEISIDMPVEIVFEDVGKDIALPKFAPKYHQTKNRENLDSDAFFDKVA